MKHASERKKKGRGCDRDILALKNGPRSLRLSVQAQSCSHSLPTVS